MSHRSRPAVCLALVALPWLVLTQSIAPVRAFGRRVLVSNVAAGDARVATDAAVTDAQAASIVQSCTPQLLSQVAPRAYTSCRTDHDCTIQLNSCCPPCGFQPSLYRAVNRRSVPAFSRLSCPQNHTGRLGDMIACPACAGGPPNDMEAICDHRQCRLTRPPEGCRQ